MTAFEGSNYTLQLTDAFVFSLCNDLSVNIRYP